MAVNLPADIAEALTKLKPIVDRARAFMDAQDAVVDKEANSFLGKIAEHVPEAGQWLSGLVEADDLLTATVNAVGGVVDAYASPATAPVVPQATPGGLST